MLCHWVFRLAGKWSIPYRNDPSSKWSIPFRNDPSPTEMIHHLPKWSPTIHIEKSFQNIFRSNQIWIVITLFWFISHQKKMRLVPNWSEDGKYNPIQVDIIRFIKDFSVSKQNQIILNIYNTVCFVINQSEHSKYNLISIWFNKISKRFLCVYLQ